MDEPFARTLTSVALTPFSCQIGVFALLVCSTHVIYVLTRRMLEYQVPSPNTNVLLTVLLTGRRLTALSVANTAVNFPQSCQGSGP